MSHRTQITLTDRQYERLTRDAERTGASLAELVRRALDASLIAEAPDRLAALERARGVWGDRDFDGVAYVERMRRPGLGARLAGSGP